MAMEAALSMLDGREFEILLAVIFSMGIFTGFVLSQAFCKSRGVNVTINGKERHSHRDEEVNAKMSVSRGVETTLGPVEVFDAANNFLGIGGNCSSAAHFASPREGSKCKACEKIVAKEHWKVERSEATAPATSSE